MQNNSYKVIFSERASEMLLNHIRFMANVSISAAKNLRGGIMKAVQEIANMPNSNPWLIDEYIRVDSEFSVAFLAPDWRGI